jgi:hypothetical protein
MCRVRRITGRLRSHHQTSRRDQQDSDCDPDRDGEQSSRCDPRSLAFHSHEPSPRLSIPQSMLVHCMPPFRGDGFRCQCRVVSVATRTRVIPPEPHLLASEIGWNTETRSSSSHNSEGSAVYRSSLPPQWRTPVGLQTSTNFNSICLRVAAAHARCRSW